MPAALLGLLGLAACKQPADTDVPVDPTPRCDGILQELEELTDAPFDRDGDGFFDAANPDCVAAWPPDRLDCDDDDPAIHPAAFEITCDGIDNDCREASPDNRDDDADGFGICDNDCNDGAPRVYPGADETCFDLLDNDCDGTADNDCGEDYNGTWQLDADLIDVVCQPLPFIPPLVDIDFDQLEVIWTPPALTISPVDSVMPTAMNGTGHPNGTFRVELTVGQLTPGICQERYVLEGRFTSADTLEATFSYAFEPGSPGSCGGCNLVDSVAIAATRL